MMRVATFMSVKPGLEERYIEEHRNIWPEILDGIRRFGIRNYSIFMHGRELYSYFEVEDLQRAMEMAAADPDNKRWQAHMANFFDVGPGIQNGSTVTLTEVFHAEGYTGPINKLVRVGTLMKLKAGMEKVYLEQHQNIWQEVLEGIARVKIRNYTIFQMGLLFFSYFQVEDLDNAVATLEIDPNNRRWQEQMARLFDGGPGFEDKTALYLKEVFFVE